MPVIHLPVISFDVNTTNAYREQDARSEVNFSQME